MSQRVRVTFADEWNEEEFLTFTAGDWESVASGIEEIVRRGTAPMRVDAGNPVVIRIQREEET